MKIALCAIVKNEERDILEWLLYHSAIGFDAIVLYDNGSEDQTYRIASAAQGHFDLRLFLWPEKFSQRAVYEDCYKRFGGEFDWICYLDCDEFLVPVKDRSVKGYLSRMEKYSAIAVNWVTYGSSGRSHFPEGLVVDNFLYRGKLKFSSNRHVKSFVRPKAIRSVKNPHFFALNRGYDYVNALGGKCVWIKEGKLSEPVGLDTIRINHYYTKSREHYQIKLRRGNADSGTRTDQFDHNDRNEAFDPVIPKLFEEEVRYVKRKIAEINDGLNRPNSLLMQDGAIDASASI